MTHVRRLDLGDPARSRKNPDAGLGARSSCQTKENALDGRSPNVQIAVREDVAKDPAYLKAQPDASTFFTDLVGDTHYRPAYPSTRKISTAIQAGDGEGDDGHRQPGRRPPKVYDDGVKRSSALTR